MQADGNSQNLMEGKNGLIGKLAILSFLAVGLLLFPPLSILSPVPFAFAALILGRSRGMAFAGAFSAGMTFLAFKFPEYINPIARGSFFLAMIGIFLAEIYFRKIHPIKGFVSLGIFLNLFFGAILGTAIMGYNFSPKKIVEESVTQMVTEFKASNKLSSIDTEDSEDARALMDMVNKPQTLVDKIMSWLPAGIFITIFFTCWLCNYVILRNSLFWRKKINYPFGIRDFLKFKVPDFFVYPLIIALALTLGGEHLLGNIGTVIGGNLLYGLGMFYFFHGLGIFVDLLDYLKVYGLLRTLMFAVTFFFAWRVLVIAGVFDLWVNFRKFFNKNNNLKS